MLRIMCLIVFLASCHAVPQGSISRRTIMRQTSTTSSTTPSTTVSMTTAAATTRVTHTPYPKRYPIIGGLMVERLGNLAAPALQWHAGIYTKRDTPYSQICGGTIVKRDVIISAAHCFWSDDIGALSAGLYAVAAGKLLRAWDALEDAYAQFSDVTSIQLPVRFRGQTTNFQDDLAVLRLGTPLEYGPGVRPACVSFQPELENNVLKEGNTGRITGWGLTQEYDGGPSRNLNFLSLPYISTDECYLRVDVSFLKYLTSDKMCAGYWDAGLALCRGDSGGGYTFEFKMADTVTVPYLLGIASTAQRDNDKLCNANTPASFTQVSFHKMFLQNHVPGIEEECRSVYASNSSTPASEPKISKGGSSPGTTTATARTLTVPTPSMTTSTPTVTTSTPTPTTPTPTSTTPRVSESLPKPAAPKLQWHAAIYFKTPTEYKHVCAGSVVKRDVIISAAHCFYNEQFNSINAPFVAAAGKLLKPYNASEDAYAQYSDVKALAFPKNYKGAKTYYQDDIAVVQLSTPFRYTAGLQPVCVSFSPVLAQPDQWKDNVGQPASTYQWLTGWSLNDMSYGGSSPTLTSRSAPMSNKMHCEVSYGPAFRKFLTSDKICAGFWTTAKAFCRGDSGTGLTHYSFINKSTLAPYLFAVASTLQGLDKICNVPEFSPAIFTLIRSHEEFLKEQVPGLEEECRDVYLGRDQSEEQEGNQDVRIVPGAAVTQSSTVQNEISSVITPAPSTSPNTEAPKLPLQAVQAIAAVNQPRPEDVRVSVDNGTVKITVSSVHTVTFELPRRLVNRR